MNLSTMASIALVFTIAAIPQLVSYLVTRNENSYVEPEYEHDYR